MKQHYESSYPHRDRVELVTAALSDHSGETWFVDLANGESHIVTDPTTPNAYRIETLTIDEFARRRAIEKIDFLKIDAEGYDPLVLAGAGELLSRSAIDLLMFEYNCTWIETRTFLRDVVERFEKLPYQLFRLYHGFLAPFHYTHKDERHDLGCNFIGVSKQRLAKGDLPIRRFP